MTTTKRKKRKRTGRYYWVAAAVLCLLLCVAMVPAQAANKQKNDKPVTYTTHTDGVTVTATADKGVLSDDAQLVVKAIDKDADNYKAVEKQVKSANKNVAGFLAYDISFTDGDHKAIEPDGDVSVKLDWDEATKPDGAAKSDDVALLHLKENKDGKVTKTEDLTKHDTTKLKQRKGKIESASFTTDSFSVFTITWTNNDNPKSTIGNVSMHYVNEDGLEIDRTAMLGDNELSKTEGQVVKIADWVNDANNTRKVSGCKYVKATIGTFKGKEITAVKVKSATEDGKTVYKLYYTTDKNPDGEDVTWTQYTDSVSKNDSNNADIYLVFRPTAQRINVHFVDEDGNIIINPIYHYANETYEKIGSQEFNIKETDESKNPWAEPIQNYKFTGRVHVGEVGWQGFAFSRIKATDDDDGNYRYQYSLDGSGDDWTDLTAADVYLIYKKTMPEKLPSTAVQIHYIDADGNPMKDEAGNLLDRTVDASDWTSGQWQNIQGYSESVNGYTIDQDAIFMAKDTDEGLTYINPQYKENNQTLDQKTCGAYSGTAGRYLRIVTDPNTKESKFQIGLGYEITGTGNVGNSKFSGNKTDKIAPESKINRYWDINGKFTIYLVYDKDTNGKTYSYTIHYVDEQGNKVAPDSQKRTFNDKTYAKTSYTVGIGKATTDDYYNLAAGVNPSGYTVKDSGFLGRPTAAQGGIPFTSITYTRDNETESWKYQINGEGEARELNLTNLDFYVVYQKADTDSPVTIHFVDMNGKDITQNGSNKTWETRVQLNKDGKSVDNGDKDLTTWQGWDFTNQNSFNGSTKYGIPDGYSFVGEYIGPSFNMDENKLVTTTAPNKDGSNSCVQWTYQGGKWYISYNNKSSNADTSKLIDGSDKTVTEGYVTDIYWVYTKTNINVHYVKLNDDNTISSISNPSEQTISQLGNKGQPTSLDGAEYAPKIDNLTYVGTRLGPASVSSMSDFGPDVRNVYLDNGKRVYYFTNPDGKAYQMTKQGNNDMWLYASPIGRRFTLRKSTSGNDNDNNKAESYTIEDSQNGTFTLNKNGADTYVATFHGETQTTEYKVTKGKDESGKDTYELTVQNYLTSDLDDVYEVYRDDTSNNAAITINNDLKYSGYLTSDLNSWLKDRMVDTYTGTDKITDYYYSWNKITTGDGYTGEKSTEVVRAQNGPHWNIAYNRKERTSLDVEADNGGRNDTNQKTVAYTVTFHYRNGNGAWQTVTSPKCTIDYYSQLMNGDFETPNKTKDGEKPTAVKDGTGFYINSEYKKLNGVWQTTASDNLIEIVNTTMPGGAASYGWNDSLPFTAAHGDQFAELNANQAGALYQDVVTHPNTYLNYWFSHRARGKWPNPGSTKDTDKKAIPEYDTMYLVIMPTRLAMTGSSNGGELKTQTELQNFIQNHGGYDTNKATAVGQEVTYRNDTDGILIEKVSSNDQFWHHVNVPNGYIAKGGLTRFFFVAGSQAYDESGTDENTHGNFIDNVGFDQQLPTPDGFNLTVSKTFSGLTQDQIASLVDSNKGDNKFKIKITDHAQNPLTGKDEDNDENTKPNSALNGAVLSFTKNTTGGAAVPFVATAVDKEGKNLLTGSNNGAVMQNDDGSITMTWTFLNENIDSTSADQTFNYYATETGADVSGYSLSSEETVSPKNETAGMDKAAVVKQKATAKFTFNNAYKDQKSSDQPRIVVSKTFKGVTPSAVDELFADGYQMTVSNGEKSYTLNTNKADLDDNVSYTTSYDNNHNTTVRWTIENQGAGTYTVTENGYNTTDYKITEIKVNGKSVIDSSTEKPPTENATESGITVGNNGATTLTFDSSTTRQGEREGESENYNGPTINLPTDTNLIIAQFQINGTSNYFVWTPDPVGADVAQSILNKINDSDDINWKPTADADKAKTSNTYFRSGENPGMISTEFGSFNYDSRTGALNFTSKDTSQATWNKFYSTKATGLDTADIRVENRYNPVVRIQKVDSSDQTKTLSGAEFKLFKFADNDVTHTTRQYIKYDGTVETSGGTGDTFITGSNGIINLPALPPAENKEITYYLEETKAPDGYNREPKLIAFTVNSDNSVVKAENTGAVGVAVETPDIQWEHPFYTIQVTNSAGTALPITGGTGTALFIIIGAIIAICATAAIAKRRQNLKG